MYLKLFCVHVCLNLLIFYCPITLPLLWVGIHQFILAHFKEFLFQTKKGLWYSVGNPENLRWSIKTMIISKKKFNLFCEFHPKSASCLLLLNIFRLRNFFVYYNSPQFLKTAFTPPIPPWFDTLKKTLFDILLLVTIFLQYYT